MPYQQTGPGRYETTNRFDKFGGIPKEMLDAIARGDMTEDEAYEQLRSDYYRSGSFGVGGAPHGEEAADLANAVAQGHQPIISHNAPDHQVEKAVQEAAADTATPDPEWMDEETFKADYELYDDPLAGEVFGDPVAMARREEAMGELFGLWDQGGLTANERAKREGARRDAGQWLRGQREADMADLAERGMLGGGAEIATMLGNRQAAADRISREDLDTAAYAEERALNALLKGQDAAEGIYDDRWAEDTYVAEARDSVNQKNKDILNTAEKEWMEWVRGQYDKSAREEHESYENKQDRDTEIAMFLEELGFRRDTEEWDRAMELWTADKGAVDQAQNYADQKADEAAEEAGDFATEESGAGKDQGDEEKDKDKKRGDVIKNAFSWGGGGGGFGF